MRLGLFGCLQHGRHQPVASDGPRARKGLVQKVLRVGIGKTPAAKARIHPGPATDRINPALRNLGQQINSQPRVHTALGVVGGAGQQGLWPL